MRVLFPLIVPCLIFALAENLISHFCTSFTFMNIEITQFKCDRFFACSIRISSGVDLVLGNSSENLSACLFGGLEKYL